MKLNLALLLLALLAWPAPALLAQEETRALPEVTEHGAVTYPPLAQMARIPGLVHLRVTTDGHSVTNILVTWGHPLLAAAAEENVRTWKFADHIPGSFDVTFNFTMEESEDLFLRQPGIVEVIERPTGGIVRYTLPEKWNVHIRSAQGGIETQLVLWTWNIPGFMSELGGYSVGAEGHERRIRNPHIDGDMLGFDATFDDKYGQRLKFSMIGKKTGDKIKGVFLNYWGGEGTWTAERAVEPAVEIGSATPLDINLPSITKADIAYHENIEYSALEVNAGIQGKVHLRATTDGLFVTEIHAMSGNPFLVLDATANLRTWIFNKPAQRTFDVIYDFQLSDGFVQFLKEPGVVKIVGHPGGVNPQYGTIYIPPVVWDAQFTSLHGRMLALLSLGMSDDILQGHVGERKTHGPNEGNDENEIREAHKDGDILGFDATIEGPDGKPIKISVLGKRTGNKIKGIFLDDAGRPGKWTATRQPSPAKPAQ